METTEQLNELKAKLSQLANSIVTDPTKLKDFVYSWSKGFHHYSFFNYLLIYSACPHASLVAGFAHWKKHNRHVKKGEKAIRIFAPLLISRQDKDETNATPDDKKTAIKMLVGFRIVSVFDISQTAGEPIELGCQDLIHGNPNIDLDKIASLFPYPLTIEDKVSDCNGRTNGKEIFITRHNSQAMLATYFHELAHCMLEHVSLIAHTASEPLPRSIAEMEAEAVSYLVSNYVGIDNDKSALYLGNWRADKEKLENSGIKILKVAEQIIKQIQKLGY
ncbi:ArdC family protein [Dehalococcoides mccartyi]|uniref:ArdC family protein n=1 Tax=Dehalococcoides mccartyi TaxID=61435 RepID=UPI000805A3C5|nr:ArdC family protein [Dehalococcoides mccartyi]OBW62026.1 MAG: hypothetical protein A9181_03410 [Dehalococcoides mccartyi]